MRLDVVDDHRVWSLAPADQHLAGLLAEAAVALDDLQPKRLPSYRCIPLALGSLGPSLCISIGIRNRHARPYGGRHRWDCSRFQEASNAKRPKGQSHRALL